MMLLNQAQGYDMVNGCVLNPSWLTLQIILEKFISHDLTRFVQKHHKIYCTTIFLLLLNTTGACAHSTGNVRNIISCCGGFKIGEIPPLTAFKQ